MKKQEIKPQRGCVMEILNIILSFIVCLLALGLLLLIGMWHEGVAIIVTLVGMNVAVFIASFKDRTRKPWFFFLGLFATIWVALEFVPHYF